MLLSFASLNWLKYCLNEHFEWYLLGFEIDRKPRPEWYLLVVPLKFSARNSHPKKCGAIRPLEKETNGFKKLPFILRFEAA